MRGKGGAGRVRSAARDRVAGFLEAGAVGPVLHATVDGVDDLGLGSKHGIQSKLKYEQVRRCICL